MKHNTSSQCRGVDLLVAEICCIVLLNCLSTSLSPWLGRCGLLTIFLNSCRTFLGSVEVLHNTGSQCRGVHLIVPGIKHIVLFNSLSTSLSGQLLIN